MARPVAEAYAPLWKGGYEHYAYYGGRGGGKSHGIGEALVGRTSSAAERVVCGREYQNSIKDSVKELIEKKIYDMNMAVFYKSTTSEIVHVGNGSRYTFLGMNRNPESAKSLEGCTIFWGEEAQMFSRHSIEIIVPTVRAPGSSMVWSWNSRYRTDEVDVMFRGPAPPENSYIRMVSWRDNPWFYQTRMPSEYRRSQRAKPKRHGHIWEGDYDENPDTAIFTEWNLGRPLCDLSKAIPRFGMDFGYGSDPFFLVKLYVLEDIDTIYFAQESTGHKVANRHLAAMADQVTESRLYPIIGDSSRPETIEYMNSEGFNVLSSKKGSGSVKNGINYLQGYRLLIDPTCVNLHAEIRDYRWAEDPAGRPLPMPVPKSADHGIDAARYAVEDLSLGVPAQGTGVDHL